MGNTHINGEILTEQDFLVIMCETKRAFIKTVNSKEAILIDLPNLSDLSDWSCVNLKLRKKTQH